MQVLVTGAEGRLGQFLRAAWQDEKQLGFQAVWSSRLGIDFVDWDLLSGPVPEISKGAVILHLAGVLRGDTQALSANAAMAKAVCLAGQSAGARHVFLASSAAVYGQSSHDLVEVQAPNPKSDYGRAKLDMERDALCLAHSAGANMLAITCLRIGNVLGADCLFGGGLTERYVTLDPVAGHSGGPERSYIGPRAFAQVVARLIGQIAAGVYLPKILNIAAAKPVFMADLLTAAKVPFRFGRPNTEFFPKVSLSTKRLAALVPLGATDAAGIVADWQGLAVRP